MPVVTAQVARVRGSLIEVGLLRIGLALELDHDDGAADQEHDVGPARLQRQLVLEDRGVLLGESSISTTSPTSTWMFGIESSQARTCDSLGISEEVLRGRCGRREAPLGEGGKVALPAVTSASGVAVGVHERAWLWDPAITIAIIGDNADG